MRRLGSIRRQGRGQAIVAGARQIAVWALLCLLGQAASAETCEPPVAKVFKAQGQVELSRGGAPRWQRVGLDQSLCPHDRLRLGPRSRATVRFANETLVDLDEGSTLILHAAKPEETGLLELLQGALHAISRMPRQLNIRTPIANAGVEGTEFALRVDPTRAELWVYEGRVLFENAQGQLRVAGGEAAVAQAGRAPERRIVVKPRQAVEWALYYPPLLDSRPESYPEALRPAILAYRRNDFTAAFAALDGMPEGARDARYHTLRAGLLLSVGRVPEAEKDLSSAERLDPKNGTAYALRSVIAVVRNEGDEALKLAAEAVRLAPGSATPYVARSYAEQSAFEIEPARESLEKAAELAPEDALVWARLAELELSRGDLDAALTAATKAETLDPGLARTQTVLGFAYLTRIEVDEARAAFDRAIARDPADPLPRLGLGLAKIRDGDLDAGTEDIEIAASLDPNNSLVRSYLGKAYFEQKRGGLASTEFEQAKLLDPKDPTPWFYDAIHKQTTNRPVEALHDLQGAIELNDNRAVYRSKLLLDQDLAARSAALGRTYRDLGFEQLALVEGWKSVNADPSDYSGHRLLADSYSGLQRHDIARVSELLQSQLLQPLNLTPVQPNLAEINNALVLEGAGPSAPAFNEFNPLFVRDRFALQTSAIIGSNSTVGDEVTQSGVWGKVSYSLGQFHFETDGFRQNNDLEHDIYDLFTQVSIAPQLSIQGQVRSQDTDAGDLRLRFDRGRFEPNLRRTILRHSGRFGIHYKPTPSSDLIGSVVYFESDVRLSDREETVEDLGEESIIRTIENNFTTSDSRAISTELQHLMDAGPVNIVLGVGYSDDNRAQDQLRSTQAFLCDGGCEPLETPAPKRTALNLDNEHINAYAYANVNFLANVSGTIGLDYDSFESAVIERNKLSPKVGIIWEPFAATTVRAAYVETIKRPFASSQTIEPTQVAGFNQFFDDLNGSETWRYGIALDQAFSTDVYAGVEASWRGVEKPDFDVDTERTGIDDQDEQLHRAYLYWTLFDKLALSAQYFFEEIEIKAQVTPPPANPELRIVNHRVPLGLSYHHPTGFFGRFTPTYIDQDLTEDITKRHDNFWVLDAMVGYRLPRRWGIVQVGVKNITDEEFDYHDLNITTGEPLIPLYQPDRFLFAQVTLAF